MIAGLDACLAPGDLMNLQAMVKTVHAAAPLLDYIQALVEHSRRSPEYATGLSPRAALALLHASRAWALIEGRDKVLRRTCRPCSPAWPATACGRCTTAFAPRASTRRKGLISAVPIREARRVLQYSQAYNFFQWVFRKHAPERASCSSASAASTSCPRATA